MAATAQVKVNQLAKDLGLKTKDITDVFAEAGIEVKTQKALEPFELDLLLEKLTRANQVENIEDYIDGVTYIPSTKPAAKNPRRRKSPPPRKSLRRSRIKFPRHLPQKLRRQSPQSPRLRHSRQLPQNRRSPQRRKSRRRP